MEKVNNKTYGIKDIYTFYKKEHRKSIKSYKEMFVMYDETVNSIKNKIYDINNKLGVYAIHDTESDNIKMIKDHMGSSYDNTNGYVMLLRGYYKQLRKNTIHRTDYKIKLTRLSNRFLTENEFKYIYKSYNFHFSNAILEGYREFYISSSLGKIVIDTFKNDGRKRGIDWGTSNKIKADLLKNGKTLYKETKHEDGTVTNNGGEKWTITYNHKEFDAFWKWKAMRSTLSKTHVFKPTNYRPTIIFDSNGNQLTTSELSDNSTLDEIKSYKIGNNQKTTIFTSLDEDYYKKYVDGFVLKDYKITYKVDF